jgi:hypothetical protein
MMMIATPPSFSLEIAPCITQNWQEALRLRWQNIQTITGNFAKSAVQDTGTFKIGSALIASAALVAARVVVATASAKKEAETSGADSEQTQFCKDQAMMTAVREIGGFTSSWLFMSLFNVALDKPSQLLFGVRVNKHGVTGPITFLSKIGQQLIPFGERVVETALPIAVGDKRTIHVLGMMDTTNPAIAEDALARHWSALKPNTVQLFCRQGLDWLVNKTRLKNDMALDAFYASLPDNLSSAEKAQHLTSLTAKDLDTYKRQINLQQFEENKVKIGFKNIGTYVVPVIGAGISTVVAGWGLERATLLHFPEVIDRINKLRDSVKKMHHKPSTVNATNHRTAAYTQTNPYLNDVLATERPWLLNATSQLQGKTVALLKTYQSPPPTSLW